MPSGASRRDPPTSRRRQHLDRRLRDHQTRIVRTSGRVHHKERRPSTPTATATIMRSLEPKLTDAFRDANTRTLAATVKTTTARETNKGDSGSERRRFPFRD